MTQASKLWWTTLVAPLALACSAPGPALTERRYPLADETQTSQLLGFSLEQVLPAGPHVSTLTWNEGQRGIEFSPALATTELRWSLELPAGEPLRIDEIDVECDRERLATNVDSLCEDRLEAGLRMQLESADGALSEDIAVTLTAQSLNEAYWNNGELDFEGFAGSFSMSASQGYPETLRLGLFADVIDGEFHGSFYGDIVLSRQRSGGGSSSSGAVVNVAQWGLEPTGAEPEE